MPDKIQSYKDEAGEWRWKRTAPNNEEVGASTEGYINLSDCMANATRINGMGENVEYLPPENSAE
jgi:uncharacterized protein YegP (UPF0339 family)